MAKPKPLDQLRADIGVRLKQSPVVFLANTNTEKERAETQLAQEQHKLERLENGTARVSFERPLSDEELAQAVESAGFDVLEIRH